MPHRRSLQHRLKASRLDAGLSQQQVADAIGITQGAYSELERTEGSSSKHLYRIAKVLGVLPEWLEEGYGPRTHGETRSAAAPPIDLDQWRADKRSAPMLQNLPLISAAVAAHWGDYNDPNPKPVTVDEWITVAGNVSPASFCLRMIGDSMISSHPGIASIPENALVVVDPKQSIGNGQIVAAKLPGVDDVVIKRYVTVPPDNYLCPTNDRYSNIKIEEGTKIVGVVRQVIIEM